MFMDLLQEKDQIAEIINNPYKYAAIYARESNASVPNPIETQKHFCREYALNKNLLIYKEYSELISASLKSYSQRPKFMELLNDAEKGYFKTLIVTRRDRMTRNFEEFIELRNIFKKLDVEILYSSDIEITDKKSYATGFIENIIMGLAEMEPRRIKQRIEAGRNAKIQKQIYDKAPSYGFKYDKHEKFYYKDDVKFKIVQDIFDIFLNDDQVTDHKELLNKLKNNKEINDTDIDFREYFKLVSELKPTDIKNILSKPFYAGIQVSNTIYKYNMFYVKYNEAFTQANEEFFIPFSNIETTVVTPKQWYEVVDKWCRNNKNQSSVKYNENREKVILEKTIRCDRCNKILKYSKGIYSCNTTGCKAIRMESLIRNLTLSIVEWLSIKENCKEVIDAVIKELDKKIAVDRKKVLDLINEQKNMIDELIASNDQSIKSKIVSKQKNLEDKNMNIKNLISKKEFINGKLRDIMPLAKEGYYDLIADDLEQNYPALLEIFILENVTELRLNGQKYSIIDRRKSK